MRQGQGPETAPSVPPERVKTEAEHNLEQPILWARRRDTHEGSESGSDAWGDRPGDDW